MPDIACLGILVADLLGRPIDSLPPRGRLGLVEEMTLHIGGCASNTGIDLVRLGVPTAVLGKVGGDGLGDFVVATLERDGIDTRGVVRDGNVGTSASMVLVASDGERTFLHHLGGNARYTEAEVRWEVVEGCRLLHVAGALVMPALDGGPMAAVLRRARERGLLTSLDTVWDATGAWMRTLGPCLPYADYFLPSLSEARELTGRCAPREVAAALRDAGVGTVGLKLGTNGCYVASAEGDLAVPAFRVEAVDGTGSGDAWDAGFLTGVLRGWDIERAARFANAVGALCVTAMGATAGVVSMEETEAFLARVGRG
ncbi:MAG: sugar kinase [Chthonomonadales bacterium]|nr:sugar kinase [Chthonomonadales bacterium]